MSSDQLKFQPIPPAAQLPPLFKQVRYSRSNSINVPFLALANFGRNLSEMPVHLEPVGILVPAAPLRASERENEDFVTPVLADGLFLVLILPSFEPEANKSDGFCTLFQNDAMLLSNELIFAPVSALMFSADAIKAFCIPIQLDLIALMFFVVWLCILDKLVRVVLVICA